MTEQAQVTDGQVLANLIAEEEFQGCVIKPWTIKQLILVMPILEALVQEFKAKGFSLDNLAEVFEGQGLGAAKDMVQAILPRLPEFLSITLKISKDQAEEIDLAVGIQLTIKVLRMNVEHLKNSFGLIMEQMGGLVRPGITP